MQTMPQRLLAYREAFHPVGAISPNGPSSSSRRSKVAMFRLLSWKLRRTTSTTHLSAGVSSQF